MTYLSWYYLLILYISYRCPVDFGLINFPIVSAYVSKILFIIVKFIKHLPEIKTSNQSFSDLGNI